nr:PREDICTED: chaperone protein DnaJ isoform X1 [Musa acuminata subsp. malaccensis]
MRRAATPRALGNGPMGRFPAARLANGGRCLRIPARSLPIADEFAALGLTPFASRCDVKRAYKRLALKYHPDVVRGDNGGGEKDETFREIKSAYEVDRASWPSLRKRATRTWWMAMVTSGMSGTNGWDSKEGFLWCAILRSS